MARIAVSARRFAPMRMGMIGTMFKQRFGTAPYLTPTPYRGKPNASYLIPLTMRAMAQVREDDLESLCRAVDANTEAAFGGPWGPD